MWKNSLKNVESDKNKIFTKPYSIFFLQRNGIYCLNKPRMYKYGMVCFTCNRVSSITVGILPTLIHVEHTIPYLYVHQSS